MKKTFDVDLSTVADMGARATVQVETEGKTEEEVYDEAERLAKEKANSGDVSWEYQGLKEPLDIEVCGIS
jgi:Flp pilus assembly protein TadG